MIGFTENAKQFTPKDLTVLVLNKHSVHIIAKNMKYSYLYNMRVAKVIPHINKVSKSAFLAIVEAMKICEETNENRTFIK